jgi:outer membrane murein-binding lipoprotein Lpp
MNDVHFTSGARLRRMGLALVAAAALGTAVLSGCGSNTSSIESSAKEQIQEGTKKAEEGLKEGTKAAEAAVQEAKEEASGENKAQIEEGLNEAEEGIKKGKAEAEKELEETKKQIEEATE